jgi:hypothetical protein
VGGGGVCWFGWCFGMQVLAEGRERCLRSLLARLRKLVGLVVVSMVDC